MSFSLTLADAEDWAWMARAHAQTAWESLSEVRRARMPLAEALAREPAIEAEARAPGRPPGLVVVACDEAGARVGFIWVEQAPSGFTGEIFAMITEVFVEKAHRRRGIGGLLLREAIAWTRANGMARVVLNVAANNAAARALYASVGFEVDNLRMSVECEG
jgi:ribosomal protein S18 acetylase RimI-like enzyme